jgi:hypothetical protein
MELSAAFVDGDLSFSDNSRFLPAVPIIEFSFSVVAAIDFVNRVIRHPQRGHQQSGFISSPGAGRAVKPPTREPHEIANGLGVCGHFRNRRPSRMQRLDR